MSQKKDPKTLMAQTNDLLSKQAILTMTEQVRQAAQSFKSYDCPECKTGPFDAHLDTCSMKPRPLGDPKPTSTYQEASPAMKAALRRAYRLSRVVNEQIGVMVNVTHGMGHGVPDEEVLKQAKRSLYKDGRRAHPGPDGKIFRPWGKPTISLSRDMHPLNGTTIVVAAKWNKSVDLTKPQPLIYTADRVYIDPLDALPPTPTYPATVCSCIPCREADCRPDYRATSLGKCSDTFDQECVCSNTAPDGECEGCRTWLS